ncbi:MAG: nucleotide exchange factor GrpE [Spirochaetaceae bacterium]|jgi:molecular chaperone GrpE|nr:nucleotide exchange factor GrpE [Spirochaetaceae bacterium]
MPEVNEDAEMENEKAGAASESCAEDDDAVASGCAEDVGCSVSEEQSVQTEAERIAELEKLLAMEHDLYLRKAADFENFRKRTVKEKQEAIDFANQSLLLDIIPILDDFERALKAAGSAQTPEDFNTFKDGIDMVEKRLISQLENKWSLKRFDSAGEPFDPGKHEALMMEKSAETPEAVVQEDFVKGYMLRGRVIRPAKVKVLMPE